MISKRDSMRDAFQDSRVLITGSSGFVGQYLINDLLSLNAEVFGLDRWKATPARGTTKISQNGHERFRYVSGDMTDIASLASILESVEPEYIFQLAAQSYVPESFRNPVNTININVMGTANLLESIRLKGIDSRVIFAGSSEEYGLVIYSENQLSRMKKKYGVIFPEPKAIPEVPIRETNPLRPFSPYAVSKVAGDYLMRNYYHAYGLKTIVSRAFNHECAGRGDHYVTSQITRQVMSLVNKEVNSIKIGNVSAFRDWSHIKDIMSGYLLLAKNGTPGEVYNQGSQRTNSVLSYILLALVAANMEPKVLKTLSGTVEITNPAELREETYFGLRFETTEVDRMLLEDRVEFSLADRGLLVETDSGSMQVEFSPSRYRPSEVPLVLSSTEKFSRLGFTVEHSLLDIVRDQLNFYAEANRRNIA